MQLKQWKYLFLVLFWNSVLVAQVPKVKRISVDTIPSVSKIAFGSTNSEKGPQEMWTSITEMKPDLFISLGNIISGKSKTTHDVLAKYLKQIDKKFYRFFLSRVPQLVVWNQHEWLDGVSEEDQTKLRAAFLSFYGLTNEMFPSSKGVYYAKTIENKERSVKFYLLDVNSFRSKEEILGDEQWKWLRKEVETSDAQAHILVSGFPFFTEGKKEYSWKNNYPQSFQKLNEFVALFSDKSFVFMSGGMNGSMLTKYTMNNVNYPLFEINASALNVAGKSRGKVKGKSVEESLYAGRSFGMLTIKWEDPMQFRVELFDIQSFNVREIKIYLDDLR